jgi:negative regulator of replication initiation
MRRSDAKNWDGTTGAAGDEGVQGAPGTAGESTQQSQQDANADASQEGSAGGSSDAKTFTQAEVNKMTAQVRKEGRSGVLKDLGIDPNDAAALDEVKKFIQSKKPEVQVEAEKQLEAQRKIQEAETKAFHAEVKAEILQAGINREYLEDALALIVAKCTDSDDLMETVEAVKAKYQVWFADEQSTVSHSGSKGTGKPVKPGGGSGQKQSDNLGERLAEQRKNVAVAPNPWERNVTNV